MKKLQSVQNAEPCEIHIKYLKFEYFTKFCVPMCKLAVNIQEDHFPALSF